MSKLVEEINELLIKEYISKVKCCDECFASIYCTVNGLRESRVPQDYCVKNIKSYFGDNADLIESARQQKGGAGVKGEKIDDLISRQDAIDALEEQLDYLWMLNKNENPTAEGKWYGVNWARNTIADLPSAQKKSEWIPVSERLPGDRDWHLGVFREPDTGFIGLPYICYYIGVSTKGTTKEGWILSNCTDVDNVPDYFRNLICVAWQPLPEPYKEGSAE